MWRSPCSTYEVAEDKIMDVTEQEQLTRQLRRQRAELLQEGAHTEDDLQVLSDERDSEWSERALEERLRHLLVNLDARGRERVEEINAALGRMTEGTYGLCERCGHSIAFERLQALPTATTCTECAHELEESASAVEEEDTPLGATLPADLQLLSDEELEELLWEQIEEDGRIETEELEITCRRGVVHLGGALPSQAEHSILSQLITDVFGLQDVIDRIEIEQFAWQREERDKESPLEQEIEGLGEKKESEQELYGSEDVIESQEEILTEPAPLGQPPPEEE
jgi:DnaK suppressor protein